VVIGGASDYPKHVLIPHRWPGTARTAVLVERPNRFLAVCKLGRRTVEAHVPDRGRCLDLLMPGREVALVAAAGPLRRTKYTALLARSGSGAWVSLDPGGAPRLVAAALEARILPWGLRVSRREIAVRSSRIDLLLEPGDLALWSPYLVHGSGKNSSAHKRRLYINGYVRAEDCDRGEWAFRGGRPVPLGPEPALVHYEDLRERGEPHYV